MRNVIDVWVTPGKDPTNDNVTSDMDWCGVEMKGEGGIRKLGIVNLPAMGLIVA